MSDSMKDLLLGLGFKPKQPEVREPERRDDARPRRADSAPLRQHSGSKPERGDLASQRQQPARQPAPAGHRGAHGQDANRRGPASQQREATPRTREDIDLAKAYAIRAQKEKDERIEAERLKQEAARIKREAKAKVAELLKDKALNAAEAELTRHFEYNGKIRRVHVTETQLKALNAGSLGVVQLDGRYLLVDAALAREVHALLPNLLALLVDPEAPVADDPYADPQYQVPDDLVW
jgi:uncharacterized protein YaiL (DUF2058 family)